MAHPEDFVKTFAVYAGEGKLLTLDDVLAPGKREEIEKRLTEEFSLDRSFSDSDLLSQWVIVDECLKIILPRGEFLPMSDGTKSLTFTAKETKRS